VDNRNEIRVWEDLSGSWKFMESLQGPEEMDYLGFSDESTLLATNLDGEISLWKLELAEHFAKARILKMENGIRNVSFDDSGSILAAGGFKKPDIQLMELNDLAGTEPLLLGRGPVQQVNEAAFHPHGNWVATGDEFGLYMWPLSHKYPKVIRGHTGGDVGIVFSEDGSWLASSSGNTIRLLPLTGNPPGEAAILHKNIQDRFTSIQTSKGWILVGSDQGEVLLLSLQDGSSKILTGFESQAWYVALSPDGKMAAAGGGQYSEKEAVIRVWNVQSGKQLHLLDPGNQKWITGVAFAGEGKLLSVSGGELHEWNLVDGKSKVLYKGKSLGSLTLSTDGERAGFLDEGTALVYELKTGLSRKLAAHGNEVHQIAFSADGSMVVTADVKGLLRAGSIGGETPHLLAGSHSPVVGLVVDPRKRWIASSHEDGSIRLWPIPEGKPFHTLPYDEFLNRLRSLTNLRVIKDKSSGSGYRLDTVPFSGWERAPEW
jgi:WD40 repeat protein